MSAWDTSVTSPLLGEQVTIALVERVEQGLSDFHDRLTRLEHAFVKAVEDSSSSADAVIDQLRGAFAETLRDVTPDRTHYEAIQRRLEVLVRTVEDLHAEFTEGQARSGSRQDAVGNALWELAKRNEAVRSALSAQQPAEVEMQATVAGLPRLIRRSDARVIRRVERALREQTAEIKAALEAQTTEVLDTVDAWLPRPEETPPRPRVRRVLGRVAVAILAAAGLVLVAAPFPARGEMCPAPAAVAATLAAGDAESIADACLDGVWPRAGASAALVGTAAAATLLSRRREQQAA